MPSSGGSDNPGQVCHTTLPPPGGQIFTSLQFFTINIYKQNGLGTRVVSHDLSEIDGVFSNQAKHCLSSAAQGWSPRGKAHWSLGDTGGDHPFQCFGTIAKPLFQFTHHPFGTNVWGLATVRWVLVVLPALVAPHRALTGEPWTLTWQDSASWQTNFSKALWGWGPKLKWATVALITSLLVAGSPNWFNSCRSFLCSVWEMMKCLPSAPSLIMWLTSPLVLGVGGWQKASQTMKLWQTLYLAVVVVSMAGDVAPHSSPTRGAGLSSYFNIFIIFLTIYNKYIVSIKGETRSFVISRQRVDVFPEECTRACIPTRFAHFILRRKHSLVSAHQPTKSLKCFAEDEPSSIAILCMWCQLFLACKIGKCAQCRKLDFDPFTVTLARAPFCYLIQQELSWISSHWSWRFWSSMSDTNLTAILYKKDDLRLVDILLFSREQLEHFLTDGEVCPAGSSLI